MSSNNKVPKRKRCARPTRLILGAAWIKAYKGRSLIRGYAKHFAVNTPCAVKELEMLGIGFTPEHKAQVLNNYNHGIEAGRKRKAAKQQAEIDDLDSDETFAFIIGYTSGGAPYGVTWEEDRETECRTSINLSPLCYAGRSRFPSPKRYAGRPRLPSPKRYARSPRLASLFCCLWQPTVMLMCS